MASKDSIASAPKRQKINNQNVHDTNHVYLLFNKGWECFKIGTTGSVEHRIERHKLNGFELIDIQKRVDSRVIERKILGFIKATGIQTGSDLFENQFDGWTECWHKDDLPVKTIDELIKMADDLKAKEGLDIPKPAEKSELNDRGLPPLREWAPKICSAGKIGKNLCIYLAQFVGYTDEEIEAASVTGVKMKEWQDARGSDGAPLVEEGHQLF